MLKRFASRLLPAFALLSLAAFAPSCKKGDDGGGEAPGGVQGDSQTPASDEISFRYKPGAAKLKESGKLSVQLSGGQSGRMAIDVVGTLDVSDFGAGLKVAYKVDEVRDVAFGGMFEPKAKDGEEPKDPKETLLKASGARLVDLMGNPDKDGTKALAENKKPEGENQGDGMAGSVGEFLGLPELPEMGLKLGEPVTVEKEDEQDLGGLKIPMEVESKYTLVKIDESSGKRLAEVSIETEGSGAVEMQGTLVSIDQVAEVSMVFNLDDQLPVSLHVEQTSAFSAGSQGGGETQLVIDATFEVL